MRSPARGCCLIAVLAACSRESNRPAPPSSVALQDAFAGLRFQSPLQVLQVPGESRFVVVEKRGTAQAVSGGTAAPFLDIRSRVNSVPGEAGLLGLAFHPRWAQNRQVFVNYTAPSSTGPANLKTTISRFSSVDGGATLDPASEQVLLTVEQPFENHNGGSVVFGPTACSTSGSATETREGTRSATPRILPACSGSSCGSTSTRGRPTPSRRRILSPREAGSRRSMRSDCAIRGGSASTGPRARSGSATWDRTPGKRSTWSWPA